MLLYIDPPASALTPRQGALQATVRPQRMSPHSFRNRSTAGTPHKLAAEHLKTQVFCTFVQMRYIPHLIYLKKTSSNTRQDADNARTGTCNITHLTSAHQKHLLRHCHSLLADIQRKPSKAAPSNPNCPYQSFHKVVAPA